jgi:hypothetical protein
MHVAIYSPVSMCAFLAANGCEILDMVSRFLPLTVKSRLPVSSFLIRLWLNSAIKPMESKCSSLLVRSDTAITNHDRAGSAQVLRLDCTVDGWVL